MPTQGKARFGKARAAGCECTYSFTCRPCLSLAAERNAAERNVPPPPSDPKPTTTSAPAAPACQWCGSTDGCDCEERRTCDRAGTDGHRYCGVRPCGCPRFFTCDHTMEGAPAAPKEPTR